MKKVYVRASLLLAFVFFFGFLAFADHPQGEKASDMALGQLEYAGIDTTDTAALIQAARTHPDDVIRLMAVHVLAARQAQEGVHILWEITTSEQEDSSLRETAALGLARMGHQEAVGWLKRFMIEARDLTTKVFLAKALTEFDIFNGYEYVVKGSEAKYAHVRAMSVEAAAHFVNASPPSVIEGRTPPAELISKMIKDEDALVREEAVRALPTAVDRGLDINMARSFASAALEDADPEVRRATENALWWLGSIEKQRSGHEEN